MNWRDGTVPERSAYVSEQYKDRTKLDARRRLYQMYGQTSIPSFSEWVFAHMEIPSGARVLELGCGTGELWLENGDALPSDAEILLTDVSPAMLEVARGRLQGPQFRFSLMDARALSLEAGYFDVIIANHVLYHISNRQKCISDVYSALKSGGHFYCTTNGWTHIIEFRSLIERFCPDAHVLPARYLPDAFDIENAAREIGHVFAQLSVHTRNSKLEVTNAEHLAEYAQSTTMQSTSSADLQDLRVHLEWLIRLQKHIHITICVGLFDATR